MPKKSTEKSEVIIGIDEAGRGPLAGPVSVGVFGAEKKLEKWILKNIFQNKLRDSKKLSPKKREEIYKKFCLLKKEYIECFEKVFQDQYEIVHRLENVKLRNVAKFFAHLLVTDAISWGVCIQIQY